MIRTPPGHKAREFSHHGLVFIMVFDRFKAYNEVDTVIIEWISAQDPAEIEHYLVATCGM
jgi:hypothetical protein